MELPSYFLRRPDVDWSPDTLAGFESLYREAVEPAHGGEVPYSLAAPKWQWLCYLTDNKGILVHGSGRPAIEEFEPRQSNDVNEFGDRRAVYAASDGLWAMYFAIVDRERYVRSLVNTCSRIVEDERVGEPLYFFSINEDALPHAPWRLGTIYLLPRDTFEHEPLMPYRGLVVDNAHWASPVPVRPLARLAVEPSDFPFLDRIRGHDPTRLRDRAVADPQGFPWID